MVCDATKIIEPCLSGLECLNSDQSYFLGAEISTSYRFPTFNLTFARCQLKEMCTLGSENKTMGVVAVQNFDSIQCLVIFEVTLDQQHMQVAKGSCCVLEERENAS